MRVPVFLVSAEAGLRPRLQAEPHGAMGTGPAISGRHIQPGCPPEWE